MIADYGVDAMHISVEATLGQNVSTKKHIIEIYRPLNVYICFISVFIFEDASSSLAGTGITILRRVFSYLFLISRYANIER